MATSPVQVGLRDYLQIVFHRKWVILGMTGLFVGGFGAYAYTATEIYEASNTVRIISEFQQNPNLADLTNTTHFQARLDGIVRELKTTEGMRRVVAAVDGLAERVPDLNEVQELRLPLLRERLRKLERQLEESTDPILREPIRLRADRTRAQVARTERLIRENTRMEQLLLELRDQVRANPGDVATLLKEEELEGSLTGQRMVLGIALGRLRGEVRVAMVGGNNLRVQFQHSVPEVTRDVVDVVIDEIEARDFDSQVDEVRRARQVLDERVANVEGEVLDMRARLEALYELGVLEIRPGDPRANLDEVRALPEPTGQTLNEYANYQRQLEEVVIRIQEEEDSLGAVEQEIGAEAPFTTTRTTERVVSAEQQQLQGELARARLEFTRERARNTDLHPAVEALRRRIAELEQVLQEVTTNSESVREDRARNPAYERLVEGRTKGRLELKKLKARRDELQRLSQQYFGKLKDIPRRQLEAWQLQIDYGNRLQTLQTYRTRLEDAIVTEELEIKKRGTYFVKPDPTAVPSAPVAPNRPLLILLGLMLGSFTSGGAVFFIEYADHSIRSISDVKRHLDLPVLGAISEMALQEEEVEKTVLGWLGWLGRRLRWWLVAAVAVPVAAWLTVAVVREVSWRYRVWQAGREGVRATGVELEGAPPAAAPDARTPEASPDEAESDGIFEPRTRSSTGGGR
ncbi:MAG: hypothetical protein HY722_14580 [Planctomycetes bacterium]|nr:hypothetical protein [Planctomycetota bacterium]